METKVFELAPQYGYHTNAALAKAMGVSEAYISRVRRGERSIQAAFIAGARRAFPDKSLDELFTVVADGPVAIAS